MGRPGRISGLGAVVMLNSNQGWPLMDEIKRAIAQEYRWPDLPPEDASVAVDPQFLEACAGEYELRPGFDFTVQHRDGALSLQPTGQEALPLSPISEGKFTAAAVEANVTFVKNEQGAVEKLVLSQSGREMTAVRR